MGHRARKGKQLDIRWKATDLKPLPKKEVQTEDSQDTPQEPSETLF